MLEAQVYWRLLGQTGIYQPRVALDELARDIAYFAPAAGEVPPLGVDLKVAQLATS